MDRFHQLAVYVAVAEEESFAAEKGAPLRMSAPAVTRAVAALEQSLGVSLLTRTTRYVRPTDAGLRYLDDARQIQEPLKRPMKVWLASMPHHAATLTVTAPVLFGKIFVMPHVVEYLQRYEDVEISALFLESRSST